VRRQDGIASQQCHHCFRENWALAVVSSWHSKSTSNIERCGEEEETRQVLLRLEMVGLQLADWFLLLLACY
jgi:hypothetical protein